MVFIKGITANLILNYALVKCPLCDNKIVKYGLSPLQKEYYRTKANLRTHIRRHHTEVEAEKFIKKYEIR